MELRDRSLVVTFAGERAVLSTCPPNAGINRGLTHIFNNDAKDPRDGYCRMLADTMDEHMSKLAELLGLPTATTTGLTTAADMENAVIRTEHYDNFTMTAIVTGGIDKNGGRVGDVADWHEIAGETTTPPAGTINIMLFIDAKLTDAALCQALTTCAEAKCAVCQELLAPSMYSRGIATGSGTDGTIIVANEQSPMVLTNAGKHYKLGEVIGRVVMSALKETLRLQTDLCPAWQHNAIRRLSRFGVDVRDFAGQDEALVQQLAEDGEMVTRASLLAHLIDQLDWKMLTADEVLTAAGEMLQIADRMGMQTSQGGTDNAAVIDRIISWWRQDFARQLDEMAKQNIKN